MKRIWSLFLSLPVILITSCVFVYLDKLNYKSISLVMTNISAIVPCLLCLYYTITKQKNMILEFLPFYFIIATSGSYHLCDCINYEGTYCSLEQGFYFDLDFINSYFCIATVFLYCTKFEYIFNVDVSIKIKRFMYLTNMFIFIYLTCFETNVLYQLYYLCTIFLTMIYVIFMSYELYIENFYTLNKMYHLLIGLALGLFSFIIYVCTVYNNLESKDDYWFLHAFCWHLPVMTSSMFIFEAFTEDSQHVSFYEYCFNTMFSNKYTRLRSYTSSNDFGIELNNV